MAMQLWNGVKFSKWKVVRYVLYLGGTANEEHCTADVLILKGTKEVVFPRSFAKKTSFLIKYFYKTLWTCDIYERIILSFEVSFST